jgi:type VI secretion system secreted protein VgrG
MRAPPAPSSANKEAFAKVAFSPDPGLKLTFDAVRGTEELGHPFLFELELTSGKLEGNVSRLLGTSATVTLKQSEQGKQPRYINGIVSRVVSEGLLRGAYHYRVEIRPWLWLLSHVTDCCIFQKKSAFDIITKLFRDAGFSDFEDKRQNSAGSKELEYCVQYRETTFDFVTRLMEEFGIYYYFRHEDGKHTLVFADDPNAHTTLEDKIPFQFRQTKKHTVYDHVWEWTSEHGLLSGKYTVQDYNFTTPSVDLTSRSVKSATHQHGTYEVYEYPGPFEVAGDGQKLADVRMQAIAAGRSVYHGASNSRLLHAGWKFNLDEYLDKPLNRDYLVTRSEISVAIGEAMSDSADKGETVDTYSVDFLAIPGDIPFRLPHKTPRPQIRGPQTAKVVGAGGDEITTDEYGRVKVKFHWDRSDTQDDQRTCWIRVAQSWAGNGWGAMFIPRVGMEVVVEFLEGNPDRPLITGVVYNANQKVPYALPGEKTKSTVKTNSSTGGNGFNEFRFEDKAGSEEVFFQAQKDYNKKVLNNETVSIKKDTTTTVEEGNRAVTVSQGNDSLTVSQGNHSVTVSQGNQSVTVSAGNHSLTVSAGKSDVNAATSITLTSGPSTIKISPSGVEINAPQVQITASASMTVNGGGNLSLSAGMIAIN